MGVAVWDTYVKRENGNVMHFDIIVPESVTDENKIFEFGRRYLTQSGEPAGKISTSECKFCHMEEPSNEIVKAIDEQGFYILEMEEIPSILPVNPTRREMILYLRGHYPQYRFADFKNKTTEEILKILTNTIK